MTTVQLDTQIRAFLDQLADAAQARANEGETVTGVSLDLIGDDRIDAVAWIKAPTVGGRIVRGSGDTPATAVQALLRKLSDKDHPDNQLPLFANTPAD